MGSILIGLHGVKRAGKDTTADFFTEFAEASDPALSVVRKGFADKGKWAFMRQFVPDMTEDHAIKIVDRFKEDEEAYITFPTVSLVGPQAFQGQITFRNALAQFCTEAARDIYGDDFWVDQLLPEGIDPAWPNYQAWQTKFLCKRKAAYDAPADVCLIRDLRFHNEALRIKMLGGFNIKVRRKDAEDAVVEQAARQGREVHRSELGLPDSLFDFIINNDDNDLVLAKKRTREVWEEICDLCY